MKRLFSPSNGLKFKQQLLLFSIIISTVPILIIGMISSYLISAKMQQTADRTHQTMLNQAKREADSFLNQLSYTAVQIATSPVIVSSVHHGISKRTFEESLLMADTLQSFKSNSTIDFDISVYYQKYRTVYSNRYGYVEESNFPYTEIIEQFPDDNHQIAFISPNTYPGQDELLVRYPVSRSGESPEGALLLHISGKTLRSLLESLELSPDQNLLIIDKNGIVVASKNVEEIGSRQNFLGQEPAGSFLSKVRWNGGTAYLSRLSSDDQPWIYVILTPETLHDTSRNILILTWSLTAVMIAVWLWVAIYASRRLYVPIQNELEESLPLAQQSVLMQLLLGQLDRDDFNRYAFRYELPGLGDRNFIIVIEVDRLEQFHLVHKGKGGLLAMYAMRKMAEEKCAETMPCLSAMPKNGRIALIASRLDGEEEVRFRQIGDMLREEAKQRLGVTVSVSISAPRSGPDSVAAGYEKAVGLLEQRRMIGPDATFAETEPDQGDLPFDREIWQVLHAVISDIGQGRFEEAYAQIDTMFAELQRMARNTHAVIGVLSYFVGEIHRMIGQMGYEANDLFECDLYQELYQLTTLEDMKSWCKKVVTGTLRERLKEFEHDRRKAVIAEAVHHLRDHYHMDVSLQQLSEQYGLSVSQFSKWFKSEMNTTFSQFVINLRMDLAKEWLIHTELPIKEIAERLRYTSVHNFTRIFKKTFGYPPGHYRVIHRESMERMEI